MNDIETQLHTLGREIQESYVLRKSERVRVLSHVIEHGHAPHAVPSPYHVVSFPRVFFMNRKSLALVAVFLCTGVLSYAADKSLPGDPLYNVKTQFNENVQSILTFSPQSKAKLEAALAEKRLDEAQTLALSTGLSSSTQDQIQQSFQQHSDEFKKAVQEVGVEQPDAAVTLSSDFQSSLGAHVNVLSNLADKNASSSSSSTVASDVTKEIGSLDTVRKHAESGLNTLSSTDIKSIAQDKLSIVLVAIDNLAALATSTTGTLNHDMAVSLQNHLAHVKAIAKIGTDDLAAKKYADAFVNFQAALREIKEAELTLKNASTLNLGPGEQQKILDSITFIDIATTSLATSTDMLNSASSTATSTPGTDLDTGTSTSATSTATTTNPVQ